MKQLTITIGAILFSAYLYGQGGVGINNSGNAPNTSAMLDVSSTDKGLLIPRVALTSTTDITTISSGNVTSLLVYNSVTIADVVPGYYYWDGTVWKTIGGNDADADPTNEIQDLQLVGNNLTITNNGTPTTIDLSNYLDNTDDQNIDSVILNGSNLTVYIEDGTSSAVDLSSLSDHDWYEVGGTSAPDNINDNIFTHSLVGIGTSNPVETLSVMGNIRVGGTNTGPNYISFHGTTGDFPGSYQHGFIGERIYQGTEHSELFLFKGNDSDNLTAAGPDRIRLAAGNIVFDTYHNVGVQGNFETVATNVNLITKMIIKSNGNVGIGTISPTNRLSIGNNLGTGYGISINSGSPYGGIIETTEATPSSNPAFWVRNTDGTNTSHLFRVQNNGNVGIGTISPTSTLDINGDLRIQTITPGSGADVALVADATGVVKQVAPNPVGEIIIYPMATAPTGYLICDGSAISRTTFSDLFAVLGTSYGPGDGSTTFNLPDLRGEFVRGSDNGRGVDTGRAIGNWQKGSLATMDTGGDAVHSYSTTSNMVGVTSAPLIGIDQVNIADYLGVIVTIASPSNTNTLVGSHSTNGWGPIGSTRPRNVAMNYCIRF